MWQEHDIKRLYEAIFHRKSVRAFAAEAVRPAFLERLTGLSTELTPALPDAPAAIRLLSPAQLKGVQTNRTKYYLALYAGPEEEAKINAAFMLQQLELWLSSQGIGACWMGMTHPLPEYKHVDGLDFLIALSFGKPQEALYRESVEEFQRKPLTEITDAQGLSMENLLLPLRLAPSAVNRQPWYVTTGENCLRLHMKKDNAVLKRMLKDLPLLDMGIGLCHLWLSAQAQGRLAGLTREEGEISSPKGYKYVWTMELK